MSNEAVAIVRSTVQYLTSKDVEVFNNKYRTGRSAKFYDNFSSRLSHDVIKAVERALKNNGHEYELRIREDARDFRPRSIIFFFPNPVAKVR